MTPVSTTTPDKPLTPRQQRFEELLNRVLSARHEPDVEALIELTDLLPAEDGEPLETPWHRAAINLLIEILMYVWRDRNDFYVGGNMFVYYKTTELREPRFRSPDFFYVADVDRHKPREKWV